MSTYYDLYETPDVQNTGEKQPLHARIVPSGTYSKKDFIERVSRHQPFPHNIIELGHFSISLKCTHKVMTKKEIRAESIRFDNVHLRTSKVFKLKVRESLRLERVEKSGSTAGKTVITVERRLQLLEEFLKKNGGITRLEYSSLTGLPRLKAIEDLNNFVVAGTLRKRGTGRAVFYVWKQEE